MAVVVGSALSAINHLDELVSGRADAGLAMRIGLTYLVPFCVSNYGILTATRTVQVRHGYHELADRMQTER